MSPTLTLIAFFSACSFVVAFCAVVLTYRASEIVKLGNEVCDLLHEQTQIARRDLWAGTPKTRPPVERPLNGGDHAG